MSKVRRPVGLVPLGEVPEIALKVISANIAGYFELSSEILPCLEIPSNAHNERRLQYDAGIILQSLSAMPFENCEKILGIVDLDLFIPILTYVFGEAMQGGRCALVSLYRLRKNVDGSTCAESVLLERAGKVALHELGHLYRLVHCLDPKCLMHFSGGLDALDEIPLYLCRYCSVYLKDNIKNPGFS